MVIEHGCSYACVSCCWHLLRLCVLTPHPYIQAWINSGQTSTKHPRGMEGKLL